MIAQVFEPFSGGHHTLYVSVILPALVRLLDEGKLDRVILTTTDRHRDSASFASALAKFESKVVFDVVEAGDIYAKGHKVTGMLVDSIERNKPDYLVATSADNGALSLALRGLLGSHTAPRDMISIGIMHYGSYERQHGMANRARDMVQRFSRKFSPWSHIYFVNPLLYDHLKRTDTRIKLLPHPVEPQPAVLKAYARTSLQLPVLGTYLGKIGQSNGTKAIPELLAAFRAASLPADHRLLLAGKIHPPYRELIDREYADLVREGRLMFFDRHLRPEELHFAARAVDVIAIPDYTGNLSSTLLEAVAAERPVLADRGGYTGTVVERFGLGYAANQRDHASYTAALVAAMETSQDFVLSAEARRLLDYHDPLNFVETLLQPLYARLGITTRLTPSWDSI
jgi:glycosyltransferase involved in cell wall biosynthesis